MLKLLAPVLDIEISESARPDEESNFPEDNR
jgi:hypothetical protein